SNRRLKIVYEDDDILVVEKGYGLLSMGTGKAGEETAYSLLRDYLKRKDPRNKIFIIHRLDRDTSGIMMFAKTQEAKDAMQHNWNNMVLNRKYICLVEGRVQNEEGVVRSYLVENSRMEVYSTDDPNAGGQLAVTRYRVLADRGGYTLLEVELDTGRKNQIRVHMKDIGHPIAGDRKYGARTSPLHRLALHAATLRFVHPVTRKEMNFTAPIKFKL
ncbi:MAG: RluA family pseudouridine synthase, partial [Muribaculaceae bacterium]|nr:RluA family pseudouridine synthase [Muribaculaceae bacterium]